MARPNQLRQSLEEECRTASLECESVEEFKTLPAGTRPRTPLIAPIAWRRETWREEALDHLPSKD